MTARLRIVRAGSGTTVQDLGRPGSGRFGVSPSGAMDPLSHRLANHLVGNPPDAATLEVTGAGLEVEIDGAVTVAVVGADLGASLDGRSLAPIAAAVPRAGARLTFERRRWGARAYLAVAGGLDVPLVLGSAATDLGAGIGGIDGRPLRAGDELRVRDSGRRSPDGAAAAARAASVARACSSLIGPRPPGPAVLRLVPEGDPALAEAQALLDTRRFRLSPRSARTGFRLEGEPLPAPATADRLSEPTAPGTVQLPPDGLPILLMADRNPTGGYPRLGHLCRADLPRAAQLWPGDELRFQPISVDEAVALAREQAQAFASALAH